METINLFGEVGSMITLEGVKNKMESIEGDVHINLMSEGGSVFEGFAIYNYLKATGRVKQVNIVGLCASIATLIVNAADKIVMSPVSSFMIHNPKLFLTGGEADDLKKNINALENITKVLVDSYHKRTGKDKEIINSWMKNETWFTPEEALEAGFVDEVQEGMLKAVATLYPKNREMNKEEQKSFINAIREDIKSMIDSFKRVKNMAVSLESGQKIWVDGEEMIGSEVFLANEEGEKSEEVAPDGVHVLADGRSIKVEGGIITEVTEKPDAETEKTEELEDRIKQLQEENEALKAEKASAEENVEKLQAEAEAKKEELNKIQAKVEKLSNIVFGDPNDKTPAPTPKSDNRLDKAAAILKEQLKRTGKF